MGGEGQRKIGRRQRLPQPYLKRQRKQGAFIIGMASSWRTFTGAILNLGNNVTMKIILIVTVVTFPAAEANLPVDRE